jgi:hypothetical protein
VAFSFNHHLLSFLSAQRAREGAKEQQRQDWIEDGSGGDGNLSSDGDDWIG